MERDLRKDRAGVLPWGEKNQRLHNNPGAGGDNTDADMRGLNSGRDRNFAVFQHQAAYHRQVHN